MSSYIFNPSQTAGKSVDLDYLQANYPSKSYLAVVVGGLATNASVASATTDTVINQKLLTGYAPSAGGVVSSTDTIRSAIGKLANNTLPASIIANPLTGFSATTGTITSADSILSGISKNAGNISAQSATSIQTFTNKTFGDSLIANAGVVIKGVSNQIKVYPTTDNAETSMVFNNLTSGGTGWILGQNIFGIGSGTFGIAGGTAGVALQASPTTGFLTIPKTIVFPGAEVRKRISFFDDGDATSQTDHRFNGFGKGNFTHVYQIKSTAESHVFYVATSATTSNEIFRIAGSGAVSCGGDMTVGGVINLTKNIAFPNVDVRKRFVMYDAGSATDGTQHNFDGIGKGALCVVYQVDSTSNNHIFYAATSATASNELFRIAGTGAISCSGTLASGSHSITGALTATTTANITGLATVGSLSSTGNATVGGTLASGTHNITGALTATTTANITGLATVGSLASTGNATVGGTLTVSGLLSAGGGLQLLGGNLTYYSEYDMTTTFTGAFTTSNITIKLTRVGRKVSMDIQTDYSQSGGTANVLTSSLAIPSAYRPTASSGFARGIHSGTVNSVFAIGNTYVLGTGFITITGGSDSTNFTTTGVNGFQSHCLTWMV